ncbi:phage portal protein [Antrihabitans cavernicola]|uniref:Phage portal protein n=1 Tax=Antrihabitans cavernicola TaxID=2495913 RepID=A0A5A7SB66_9NOCA|nr:phage portal protein [Spelaeibacter cavernicola]KAA0021813.1 phage portal protein [Spelaeibacter cavernicola]
MTAPNIATLDALSADEAGLLAMLLTRVSAFTRANATKEAYYEGEQRVKQLGIAIPATLADKIATVVGWSGTAVDVLEERLDFLGWVETGAKYDLGSIFNANDLDVDSGLGHLDALICGTAFVAVGTGDNGEPSPLITVESPKNMTGLRDARTRRLTAAASRFRDEGKDFDNGATLYLKNETIRVARSSEGAAWAVVNRDQHKLGRVPVAQLVNRPRSSRMTGRSEISHSVRGYTNAAVRTLLGMEVNREFYSAPQRYLLNAAEDQFDKGDGSVVTGFEAIMSRMLAVPFDEDNPEAKPEVGQFAQSQPGPYLDQVRGLAQLLAAECAIPPTYLGFATDQAASADAIRAMEARLVKRAERRQAAFGKAWLEVARLALLVRDGKVPDGFADGVSVKWRDAATPTRSAAADEATKLVAAEVLPPDSSVTYDRIGLTPREQEQVEADKRRARSRAILGGIAGAADVATANPRVAEAASRRVPAEGN